MNMGDGGAGCELSWGKRQGNEEGRDEGLALGLSVGINLRNGEVQWVKRQGGRKIQIERKG